MEALLAVIQLILVPILMAVALAVRLAGKSKPLNIVDYARVADPASLHRWAGNRLLLLPPLFCASGLASIRHPHLALLLAGAATATALCIGAWLALGVERFQRAA